MSTPHRQRLHHRSNCRLWCRLGIQLPPGDGDVVSESDCGPPERCGFCGPACLQICDIVAGLVTTSVRRRLASQGGSFSASRVTTLAIPEHFELHGQGDIDL